MSSPESLLPAGLAPLPSIHNTSPSNPEHNVLSGVSAQPFTPSTGAPSSILPSLIHHSGPLIPPHTSSSPAPPLLAAPIINASSSLPAKNSVQVQCKARTRIPTPHGPIFLHIYHNNWDSKEHLAVVVDPAQLEASDEESVHSGAFIRSRSLDAVWKEGETDMERIIRGAYVGRLTPSKATPSKPSTQSTPGPSSSLSSLPTPIVRIHSECFTGETVGSMRCDCGEQLDEAIRYISQPQPVPTLPLDASAPLTTRLRPGRGAVIYLRQEGRGIGLLEKIRAYNLQDMGHDTVTANLMLGHGADERGYEIAAAMLRDLGLADDSTSSDPVLSPSSPGIRVLTNNPDKMEALKREGVHITERLPMIPRTWSSLPTPSITPTPTPAPSRDEEDERRRNGATMIGGGAARGPELERYLRTKIQRMGHLLELPSAVRPTQEGVEIVIPVPKVAMEEVATSPV